LFGLGRLEQHFAQPAAAAVQPGHHGADRAAHNCGDLPVAESLHVGQVHGDAELVGKLPQRGGQAGVRYVVEGQVLTSASAGLRVIRAAIA
jgi:hypothetical protein